MTLRDELSQAVADVFDAVDDIPVTCVVERISQEYVPGGSTTDLSATYNTRIILDSDVKRELTIGEAALGDVKGILIADEQSFAPVVGDTVHVGSVKYNVRAVNQDPARVTYELILTSK
jgi:hypothetical protein